MPNHVTSRCTVTGPNPDIDAFRALMIAPAPDNHSDKGGMMFDFNAIIPMPAALKDVEASSHAEMGAAMILYRSDRGAPYADHAEYWSKSVRAELGMERDSIYDVAATYLAAHPDVEAKGTARLRAILATGYANLYPWAVAKWGTKWDAYRFHQIGEGPGSFSFGFETAWSFPEPVFEALAARFPSLTFDCICFDEGWNFAAVGTFTDHERTFANVPATDAMYEAVYGHPPVHDDEDEGDDETLTPGAHP